MVAAFLSPILVFLVLSVLYPLPPLKSYSLVVLDHDGRLLNAYVAADGKWRLRTDPAEIPERLKQILLRREDRWFYYHPGVNPFALFRAAWQNLRGGRRISGGSTITMQIARMLEPKPRTIAAKMFEAFRAVQLELRYSKAQLLEIYLSMVPLGGNIEGLKSASFLYYQTPPERLNIAQLFDLILIPRDPNGLQPDKHPDRLLAERGRQARRWIARGFFTHADSAVLWSTPAGVTRSSFPRYAPHFCLRIREAAPKGGDVRSTLRLPVQQTVERLLAAHLRVWNARGVRNSAVLVVDNRTRDVVAYAGSGNFDDSLSNGQFDAVQALRSPGSTLKPFLYAMLMDAGSLTPKSRLLDVPYDAEGFTAENYDGTYSGPVFADDALRRSLNVPMVRLLRGVGAPAFTQFVVGVGINSLEAQKARLGLSMILGGCGVTLEELVTAYSAFPNAGRYRSLRYIEADAPGRGGGQAAFSPSAAFMVTQILEGLNRPDLPSGFESSLTLPAVAFKTGTSYGRRDAWAIGYTASHTVGVWLGNADNSGNPDLVGGKAAAPLLFDILTSVTRQGEKVILPLPSDVSMREVCTESGKDPTPRCAHLIEDYYSVSRTSRVFCDVCREYLVSRDGSMSFCPACVGSHPYVVRTIVSYPPELLDFWKKSNIACSVAPPHNPFCTTVSTGAGPPIISPSDAMTYYLVSPKQRLSLQAAPVVDASKYAWYLDERYLGTMDAGTRWLIRIAAGHHIVCCVDDKGRTTVARFTVVMVG
jgi:penicillin-binding protein 1C